MESYSPLGIGFLHLAQFPGDASRSSQALIVCFLSLSGIPWYGSNGDCLTITCLRASQLFHLGCYEQTLMNICIRVFVWPWLFNSLTQRPKCAIHRSYGSSSFDQTTIRKKPQAACQHVYTILCSHQQSINILTIHSLGVVTNFVSHVHKCVIIHLSLQFFPSFSEV